MKMIEVIRKEMLEQMLFQSELADKMKGNTKTRIKDLSNILSYKREPGTQLLEEIAEGLGCEWSLTKIKKELKKYIIFDKGIPAYPGVYHVRGLHEGVPENTTTMIHRDLEYIRTKLKEKGMKCIGQGENNNPMVIEIWVGENLFPEILV